TWSATPAATSWCRCRRCRASRRSTRNCWRGAGRICGGVCGASQRARPTCWRRKRRGCCPCPSRPSRAGGGRGAKASSLSLVRFDGNDYSVPTAYAHHAVTVVGGIDEVRLVAAGRVVARHRRCWGKEQTRFDPVHYLALLERKPGALDFARPLEGWDLPDCFAVLRRRLEGELASQGTREFIKVLRLLEAASVPQLAEAIEYALGVGATSADAVRLTLEHRREQPVGLFRLDGHLHLKAVRVQEPDLAAYR